MADHKNPEVGDLFRYADGSGFKLITDKGHLNIVHYSNNKDEFDLNIYGEPSVDEDDTYYGNIKDLLDLLVAKK